MAHSMFILLLSIESHYLEVSVDNVKGVEISHRLQHLANHVTGVTLRVVTLVQDPVEHLSARGSAEKQSPQRGSAEEQDCAPSSSSLIARQWLAGRKIVRRPYKNTISNGIVSIFRKDNTPARSEVRWTFPPRCGPHVSSFLFYNF